MDMQGFLQNVIGVANANMRQHLLTSGFPNLDNLHEQDDDYAKNVCNVVRKMSGKPATFAERNVSVLIETRLKVLVHWCRYMYITQRDRDFVDATLANVMAVHQWYQELDADPEDTIDAFKDNIDRRRWLESIESYLCVKKGVLSGVPLSYAIRETEDFEVDEEFGEPNLDEFDIYNDVKTRGRLDGLFGVQTTELFGYSLGPSATRLQLVGLPLSALREPSMEGLPTLPL
jgi:hypothetical protein